MDEKLAEQARREFEEQLNRYMAEWGESLRSAVEKPKEERPPAPVEKSLPRVGPSPFSRGRRKALPEQGGETPPPTPPKKPLPKLREALQEQPTPPPELPPAPEKPARRRRKPKPPQVEAPTHGRAGVDLPPPTDEQIESAKHSMLEAGVNMLRTISGSRFGRSSDWGVTDEERRDGTMRVVRVAKLLNRLAELGSSMSGKDQNSPDRLLELGEEIVESLKEVDPYGHGGGMEPDGVYNLRKALRVLRAYQVGLPADTPPEIVADRAAELGLTRLGGGGKRRF